MRIHIAYIEGAHLREYEKDYVPQVCNELRTGEASSECLLEDDPARADIIILWEGFEYKTPEYIRTLENDPLIRKHADRVYAVNYDDHPEGFLAGLYTSLEAPFYNPEIHRIWPFFLMNNSEVYELSREEVMRYDPKWLFSFAGAKSHPVRKELFKVFDKASRDYHVEHVARWYDHGSAERQSFVQTALASTFCLCPHGYCSYTPRITEVMAMARVPVIIADDWIPFAFDDERPYFIQVAEKDIAKLPDILAEKRSDAEELRRNARYLWEKYLSASNRAAALVKAVSGLADRPSAKWTYEQYREHWHSRELWTNLGWMPRQRVALRIEQRLQRWFPGVQVPGVSPLVRYRNTLSHS